MLQEKQTYTFRVIRLITLPDGSQNWVLTHSGEDRYMLPAEYYTDYQIKEGLSLRCRVDKINCTGRIFLEPDHPWYQEGKMYRFTFLHGEPVPAAKTNVLKRLIFKGIHDEIRPCLTLTEFLPFTPGEVVEVLISRIKKGAVDFQPLILSTHEIMHEGGVYEFFIENVNEAGNLLITGPRETVILLESEYYKQHGLKPGVKFSGIFLHWTPEGIPHIEPLHPVYKLGKTYSFPVLREDSVDHSAGSFEQVLVVEDCFGNEIRVFRRKVAGEIAALPERILCRVERLKKGKPVLRVQPNS